MATIIYNSENIADAYAPSLNAAFQQVYRESGIKPFVIAPYGAWSSPAIDKQYGIKGRSAGSDHYKGRAVDIRNYAAIINVIGLSRLKAIMRAHGWLNIQIDGGDFSAEPWHYANHSATPAAGGISALPELIRLMEDNVTKIIGSTDEFSLINPLYPNGYKVVKNTDPLAASYRRLYSPTGDGGIPIYSDSSQYLGILKAATDEATRVQAQLKALIPTGGSSGYAGPTAEQIGAEVIRQMKLPGN